jgi:hypothetical protein
VKSPRATSGPKDRAGFIEAALLALESPARLVAKTDPVRLHESWRPGDTVALGELRESGN